MNLPGFWKKLFPLQITKRMYLFMVLLFLLYIIIIVIFTQFNAYQDAVADEKEKFSSITKLLDQHLRGSFPDILQQNNALADSRNRQIQVLNRVLQPTIDHIASAFPNVGMGIYAFDVTNIVAYAPRFKASKLMLLNGESRFKPESSVSAKMSAFIWDDPIVITMNYPIERNGRIIGLILTNGKLINIQQKIIQRTMRLFFLTFSLILVALGFAWLISAKVKNELGQFSKAIVNTNVTEHVPNKLFPELNPVLDWVNKRTNELEKFNQEISKILASITDAYFLLDHEWRFVNMNQRALDLLAKTRQEVIGRKFWDVLPLTKHSLFYEKYHQAIAENSPMHFEALAPTINRWLEVHAYPGPEGLTVYYRDISLRKWAEESLKNSNQRINNILESITDAFYTLDPQWRFTYINKEAERLWKRNKEDLLGRMIWDEFHEPNIRFIQEMSRAIDEQTAIHFEDYSPLFEFWTELHVYPSQDGLSVYFRDISERKQFEHALTAEREMLLVTLNSIGDGVIATDKIGNVILANHEAERLTQQTPAEINGKPLAEAFRVIHNQTGEPYDVIIQKTMESGEIYHLDDAVLVVKGRTELAVSVTYAPIRSTTGEHFGVVIIFKDITEKQKTEAELIKADKLESLGVLAGGIAHDFNNILAALLANVQLALIKLDKGADVKKYLHGSVEATYKASELTKQLLTFSKGGAPVRKAASIVEIIKDTAGFALHGSKGKCEFKFPDSLWSAEIDTGQVSQVINNLILNAEQAMPNGGLIEVSAQNITVASDSTYQAGRYVCIAITDHGQGISKENASKVFDPFFTTKKEGTGLGLTTSYSIIKKHNGYIDFKSKEGVGTTFYIYLPASITSVREDASKSQPVTPGKGKLLLMDDESNIRQVVGEMLSCFGYEVAVAKDGEETIALYQQAKENGQPFEAIILDLTVPGGMGGQEALARLLDMDPKVKAIVTSGHAIDPVMSDYQSYGFQGCVKKPYKFDELNLVLNEILAKAN